MPNYKFLNPYTGNLDATLTNKEVQDSLGNLVYINTINDFPAAVNGVITLEDGKEYWLNAPIITSNRFVIPEEAQCTFRSIDNISNPLVYIGSGTMFTGINIAYLRFINFVLSCPNGTVFDLNGGSEVQSYLFMDIVTFDNIDTLGTIEALNFFSFTIIYRDCGQGLILKDTLGVALAVNYFIEWKNEASSVFLTLQGDNEEVVANTIFFETNANERVFDIEAASTVTGGLISACVFDNKDRIFASGSKDQTDIYWKSSGNVNLPDSTAIAQIGFQDNTAQVVIDELEVPIKVNSSSFVEDFSERFTTTSAGEAIYNGLEDVFVKVDAHMTMRPITGTNIELGCYIGVTRVALVTVTFTNATDKVNRTAHGLANGTSIRFSNIGGALPAEIRDDQFYFVVNTDANDFEISSSLGGVSIDFTDDGTGTNSYSLGEYIISSEGESSSSSTRVESFGTQSLVEVSTGDKIEVFVDNHDSTSNIVVKGIQVIITK